MIVTVNSVFVDLREANRTTANVALVEQLIGQVVAMAETFTGRKIKYGSYTTEFIGGDKNIYLPAAPIWAIVDVESDGETVGVDNYTANMSMGILTHSSKWGEVVEVTYTAGWDTTSQIASQLPPLDLAGAIRDEVVVRFLMKTTQPRVGEGLVDLTTRFFSESAEKVFEQYKVSVI